MYLTFALGSEVYGIGIAAVTEIVGLQRIMPVPDLPTYILGVINLRGKVVPVIDVRLRFGMAERAHDERTVIIVLDVDDAPVGLIVDSVSDVLDIPADQIDLPVQFARNGTARSVIAGIGRIGDQVAVLLDSAVLVAEGDLGLPDHIAA